MAFGFAPGSIRKVQDSDGGDGCKRPSPLFSLPKNPMVAQKPATNQGLLGKALQGEGRRAKRAGGGRRTLRVTAAPAALEWGGLRQRTLIVTCCAVMAGLVPAIHVFASGGL
jgi:hypothetical protein